MSIAANEHVLDVGCGGGRTLTKLAAAASAGVAYGIDYSEASVTAARRLNHELIDQQRVKVEQASVDALPFPDNTFDLATAVETHFWWPDISAGMHEIFRVLEPGGRVLVIAEFYKGGRWAKVADRLAKYTGIASLDVSQHRAMLTDAGFVNVEIDEELRNGWISVLGTKPQNA